MKTINKIAVIALILSILIPTACSVKKRVYLSGYHVEWFKNKKQSNIASVNKKLNNDAEQLRPAQENYSNTKKLTSAPVEEDNVLIASVAATDAVFLNKSKIKKSLLDEECDVIIKKNGEEIKAKVLEVGYTDIRYKDCTNPNSPTFTISKSEVFMIKYPKGASTVISQPEGKSNGNTNTNTSINIINNTTPPASKTSNKSMLVAVLLWFFLGFLGIHRLYLGHTGMGLLYLFTGALCGIGWLVDGVLFLLGELKPKDGEYKD